MNQLDKIINQCEINCNEGLFLKPGHEKHLCKMVVGDQADIKDLKPLLRDARYLCKACRRAAHNVERSCATTEL